MRKWIVIVCLLFLAGCMASDKVSIDRAQFMLTYADAKATYAVLAFEFRQGCIAKSIPSAVCDQLAPIEDKIKLIEPEIRTMIAHPEIVPDWGKISLILGLVLELASKGSFPIPIP